MRIIIILIFTLTPLLVVSQGSIIWNTPFESTAEWSVNGGSNIWEANSYFGTLSTDSKQGSGSLQLAAADGDGSRNEFNVDQLMQAGVDTWIGFSFKIVTPVPDGRVFMQIRETPTNSTNPITFRMSNSGTRVRIATSTDPTYADVTVGTGASWNSENTYFDVNLNTWYDVVIFMNIDYQNGDMKIWINGDLLVNKENTTTTYRRTQSGDLKTGVVYPKIGPYWGTASQTGTYRYDAYKVWEGAGGTYEDVSTNGHSPNNGAGGGPAPTTYNGAFNAKKRKTPIVINN